MSRSSPDIVTELADLTEVSFDELRTHEPEPLATSVARIMSAIERPRFNLGGGGPPGRVD